MSRAERRAQDGGDGERREIYARFRVSVDNLFRGEFSYVEYRRWGVVELWEGGRICTAPPTRQRAGDCIEIWHNYAQVGAHLRYADACAQVEELLREAPAPLHDLRAYLQIRP